MTKFLKKAVAEVSKLCPSKQNMIAWVMLEEVKSERRWARAFARSQRQLAKMADQAVRDYKAGRTRPLDL